MKKDKESPDKLEESLRQLSHALTFEKNADKDKVFLSGIAKCFEVALEYCWKHFKTVAESEGLEVYSPKEAIKIAAQLNLIDDPALWISFINARNIAVRDYLGVPNLAYLKVVKQFHAAAKKVFPKLTF